METFIVLFVVWLCLTALACAYGDAKSHRKSSRCMNIREVTGLVLFWPIFAILSIKYIVKIVKIPMFFVGAFRDSVRLVK